MGRRPNITCHSPTRPWAPPINLSGGLLRGTTTSQANKVRQFVLPIPPIPAANAKAIRTAVASTVHPFAAQQNRIRLLTTKFHDQRAKASAIQKKIAELDDLKDQGLRGCICGCVKNMEHLFVVVVSEWHCDIHHWRVVVVVVVDGTTNLCDEYSIKLKLSAIPVYSEARLHFKTHQVQPKVTNRVEVCQKVVVNKKVVVSLMRHYIDY
jgi:predicted RNase H-like nuclease (RuvC/YqgF family)